jgi:hypothetical protein
MRGRAMIENRDRKIEAYYHLKDDLKRKYPKGWFVGIADDGIVGAAPTFRDLDFALRAEGKDIRQVLVVEAGVDYPNHVNIFISL